MGVSKSHLPTVQQGHHIGLCAGSQGLDETRPPWKTHKDRGAAARGSMLWQLELGDHRSMVGLRKLGIVTEGA